MELSQAAGALLRTRPSMLASAVPRRFTPFASVAARSFSTNPIRRQGQTDEEKAAFRSLLDESLDLGTKGVPTTSEHRTSHYKSRAAQQDNRVQPAAPPPPSSQGSSVQDLLENLSKIQPSNYSRRNIGAYTDTRSRDLLVPSALSVTPNVSLGRTADVQGGDVARAFRSLDIQIARNKVRADVFRQRFHERPGLKRKRLASERWRRRFKEAFRGTVKMVAKMRKQGW